MTVLSKVVMEWEAPVSTPQNMGCRIWHLHCSATLNICAPCVISCGQMYCDKSYAPAPVRDDVIMLTDSPSVQPMIHVNGIDAPAAF